VAGVAGGDGIHGVLGRALEHEVRGPLADELTEAAVPVEHQQAAALVNDDGLGVDRQLTALDLLDVVGQLTHAVGAVTAAVCVD
jgi:hypothetical protein